MQHCDDTQTASKKTLAQLPESYTSVPSAPVPRKGKFIVMFGELHMEMAALKTLVDLLDNSGWTSVLVEAGVATFGTAAKELNKIGRKERSYAGATADPAFHMRYT